MMGDLSAMWQEEENKKNNFYREQYERRIPNEPGALLDALLEFNENPSKEWGDCQEYLKKLFERYK